MDAIALRAAALAANTTAVAEANRILASCQAAAAAGQMSILTTLTNTTDDYVCAVDAVLNQNGLNLIVQPLGQYLVRW